MTPSTQGFSDSENFDLHRRIFSMIKEYAIFAVDTDGRILTWNAGAERFYGYKADDVLNENISVLSATDNNAQQIAEAHEWARRMGFYEEQGWRTRNDGTCCWAELSVTPMTDEDGEVNGFVHILRDQTKRKEAEEKLAMFRLMVSAVKDYAIILLDTDGRVLTWNEGAQRIKGYMATEIIGRNFSQFYTEAERSARIPELHLISAAHDGTFEEEGWRLRADGSRFWANALITALRDENGQLKGFAKVTRDLTERKHTEEQLSLYAKKLEEGRDQALQASTLKSQFVANVSHEIRTPMSGLLGMAELLKYEPLSEQAREIVDHIFNSAQSLLEILNDLLDFSKIEAGKLHIEPHPTEPRSIVQNIIRSASFSAEQKGIELVANVASDVPRKVMGDQLRIQQILMNLVNNALKFTPSGRIELTVDTVGTESSGKKLVRFMVSDTGIGIPPEKQKILFRPFVQADGSTTRKFGGTGLGLSISKRLCDLMSGEMGLQSEEGKGSKFWFTLPMSSAENEKSDSVHRSAA